MTRYFSQNIHDLGGLSGGSRGCPALEQHGTSSWRDHKGGCRHGPLLSLVGRLLVRAKPMAPASGAASPLPNRLLEICAAVPLVRFRPGQGRKRRLPLGNQAVQQALSAGMPVPDAGAEDCLYLNVWAPEKGSDTPRPVLVWIHGGGYVAGSGSEAVYYGDDYAERGDLVYVSINYRLNGFGFLRTSLDADSANLALLDQVAALQWIQKNIEAIRR